MSWQTLSGLDAQNPLAFFAALGLLRIVDDCLKTNVQARPRLRFLDNGQQTAQLETPLTLEDLVGLILEDASRQAQGHSLQLAYDAEGERVAADAVGARRDLKPSPKTAALFLQEAASGGRRDADLAAGFFSELVQDNNGSTKPTALHFTAGQQAFLAMVEELRRGLNADALREALEGPWCNTSTLPSLSWDSSVTRLHALRAGDPSKEKRGSVPAANWLAVHALAFFPVNVRGKRLETACIEGRWKDSAFTWPTWNAAASVPVVASLLRMNAGRWTAKERVALGIVSVLRAKILRSEQGGYGSFSPAEVVLPRTPRFD